jgi:TetR/AcrR family transcriptional regulator, transcriptional repressor for nem operon
MDTKSAILDSAEAAARARGYDGFSYADLAEAVGIRKASIHHHFPTKADLALALIERYSQTVSSRLEQLGALHSLAGDQLKAVIATYREAIDGGNKLCLCVALCSDRDSLNPAVLSQVDTFRAMVAGHLQAVFALGRADHSISGVKEAEVEALACLAQLEGAQLAARAARDPARFDAAIASLLLRVE